MSVPTLQTQRPQRQLKNKLPPGGIGAPAKCSRQRVSESGPRPETGPVTSTALDPAVVQGVVRAAGIPCGPLLPVGAPAKRQVLTDGTALVRAATVDAVLLNHPADELAWARRIGAVVPAQRPLTEPLRWGNWTLTVWEWLDGFTVIPAHAWQHGATLRTLHDLAARPAEMHHRVDQLDSARGRLATIMDPGIRGQLSSLLDVAAGVVAAADQGDLVVTHGDAHDRNLLVVDRVVHLLDFDSSGVDHRHVDVASGVYAWRINHRDENAVNAFLDGYGEHPDLDRKALKGLVWVRRVRATCSRAAAGQDVRERLAELAQTCPPH